jgi:ribosomal protein L29
MKKKDFTELKKKDLKALNKLISEKKAESLKIKVAAVAGKEKNLKIFSNLRREIAQMLTLVKEKQILEKLEEQNKVETK